MNGGTVSRCVVSTISGGFEGSSTARRLMRSGPPGFSGGTGWRTTCHPSFSSRSPRKWAILPSSPEIEGSATSSRVSATTSFAMDRVIAFIGLGANLEAPLENVKSAIARLDALDATRVKRVAPYYGSRPVGPQDQPSFVNTVAEIETALDPHALLARLKRI